jgi:polyisoprenoid-binding protein YceI
MKQKKLLALVISGLIMLAACGGGGTRENAAEISERLEPGERPENAEVRNLDTNASTVEWRASRVTAEHYGTIGVKDGELYLVNDQLVGGNIILDMTDIVVLDLQDQGMNQKLTGHLKSDDFFSSESHPEGRFEMARITRNENTDPAQPNYTISGNLTMKGITRGVSFPAWVNVDDNRLTARADFTLDRTEWDIRFRSGRFFENLGDNLIHDDFTVKLDIVATN